MSYNYNFDRLRGQDNIHINPDEYDICHHGEPITLSQRIQNQWSAKIFKVICENSICSIKFEEELTSEEQVVLNGIISDHKAIEDWP